MRFVLCRGNVFVNKRSCSLGFISLFLLLSACGGGGASSGTDAQSFSSSETSTTNTSTATRAGTLSLKWVAPAARSNGDALSLSEISSYTIYFGTEPGNYPYSVSVEDASTTNLDIPDLPAGTYYLVITATDSQGLESDYSSIAVKEVT